MAFYHHSPSQAIPYPTHRLPSHISCMVYGLCLQDYTVVQDYITGLKAALYCMGLGRGGYSPPREGRLPTAAQQIMVAIVIHGNSTNPLIIKVI